jgi:Asp-tRNA(Asn)/Glu-tRNA(Gln) amidotransferase A subunit family amidase
MSAAAGGGETEEATNAYLAQLPNTPVSSFAEIANFPLVTPTRQGALRSSIGRTTSDLSYLQAQQARETLRQAVLKVMADNDLDAIAFAPFDHEVPAIPDDFLTNPNASRGRQGSNRLLSPATGFPELTLPAGFTSIGLPVGVDLLGRPFTEELLFQIGYAYEQGTKHRRPPAAYPPLGRR